MSSSSSDEEPEMHPCNPFPEEVEKKPTLFDYYDPVSMASSSFRAVWSSDIEKLEELVQSGRNLDVIDNQGNSALHHAVMKNSFKMVRLLTDSGVNVDLQNFSGATPLLVAIRDGVQLQIIINLLQSNCDVNIKDNMERLPLSFAVKNSNLELMSLLIRYGADVNAQDGSLYTPLHEAASTGNLDVIYMLLYYNADPTLLCHLGLTPLMYLIMKSKCLQSARILLMYYDEATHMSNTCDTAFSLALSHVHPIATDLVKMGGNCGYSKKDAGKALHYALFIKDLDLFHEICKDILRLDISIKMFEYTRIVLGFLTIHDIPKQLWLDCFFSLIKIGPEGFGIFDPTFTYMGHMMGLPKTLNILQFDKDTRIRILWSLLSIGFVAHEYDISGFLQYFGNGTEVEILYQSYTDQNVMAIEAAFPCILKVFLKCIIRRKNFKKRFESMNVSAMLAMVKANEPFLGYMTFPPNFGRKIIKYKCSPYIIGKMLKLQRVPPLLELSRNATSLYLGKAFNITQEYQYFDIVNRLLIPRVIKELLLFRKPIVDIDNI